MGHHRQHATFDAQRQHRMLQRHILGDGPQGLLLRHGDAEVDIGQLVLRRHGMGDLVGGDEIQPHQNLAQIAGMSLLVVQRRFQLLRRHMARGQQQFTQGTDFHGDTSVRSMTTSWRRRCDRASVGKYPVSLGKL